MGLLNGTFEALFEYVSLDKLLTSESKNLIRALLKQGGVEASEEFMTTFANNIADILVMAEKSDYQLKIQAYMESGMSREEAAKQALLDKCIGLGWDAVGGFLSGGLSGSISTKVSGIHTRGETQTQAPTQAQAQEMTAALQNQAPQPGIEQKNTAPEEAESTAVNTDPAQHTAVEQAVIDEYQAAVDDNLVNYIETVRDNKGAKIGRYSLKPVAERAAKDIMRLTGVDVSGNQTAIEARIVEHILKRHGENGTANHSMRDINDIARIQYVLDNYDMASYGGKTQAYRTMKENGRSAQANTVIFSKAVNGTYYVVEAVPDTKAKTVFVASAYMSSKKTGDAQAADADAWRVTSETKVVQSPAVEAKTSTNAILAQSGENYHNNFQASLETGNIGELSGKGAPLGGAGTRSVTEGGTTAAEAAANTDPAAAARQRQYQTEIAAALRAGDYQLALKLFKEYSNPNLRALNEVQTLKAFGDYAAAMGYDVSPEDISTDQTLAAFEESYRNAIENAEKDGIIKSIEKTDVVLNSVADPMADVFGAGEDSHPEEIARFRHLLKDYNVELVEHEYESLGYIPGVLPGKPGMIFVSKGASYSAWVHEMCHVEDDRAAGWLGMRVLEDPDKRYAWEVHAYGLEIDLALQAGRPDIADKLRENLEKERKMIYGE